MPLTGRTLFEKASARRIATESDAVWLAALGFVSILWLGLLLGVSFLATPVKFQAPGLDLPTALEIGRVTFGIFSRVEWILCSVSLIVAMACPSGRTWLCGGAVLITLMVVAQAIWLIPVLDDRIGGIIAGKTLSASNHHLVYIVLDGLKALLLLAISIETLRKLAGRHMEAV